MVIRGTPRHTVVAVVVLALAQLVAADDNPVSDPAVIGGIAGAVVVLLIVVCLCCRKRSVTRLQASSWRMSQLLFMERLQSLDTVVRTIVDDQLVHGLPSRIAVCDAAAPFKRGDVTVPPPEQLPGSSLRLRQYVCEADSINRPIIETGLLAYQGIASAIASFGALIDYPTEDAEAGDASPSPTRASSASPSKGSCGRRLLCIGGEREDEELAKAQRLLAKAIAKTFVTQVSQTEQLARFHTRHWIRDNVVSLRLAIERRQAMEEEESREPREMVATRAITVRTDTGARVDVLDLAERQVLSTLYIRTCGGEDTRATTLLELRHDVHVFISTLMHIVMETSLIGGARATLALFHACETIDHTLARALYHRRALALEAVSDAWMQRACSGIQTVTLANKTRCLEEAAALGKSPAYADRPLDAGTAARAAPTIDEMSAFTDSYIDTNLEQYSRAFRQSLSTPENELTLASCCGFCLPDFPVVRRIVAGEMELLEHMCSQFEARALVQFAVRDDDKATAMKLLSDIKLLVLDWVEPMENAAASGTDEDGGDFSDLGGDDEAFSNTSRSVASPPRDTRAVFALPADAYKWVPPRLASRFTEPWENAPEDAIAEATRLATKELEALERLVMIALSECDPRFVVVRNDVVQQMVSSARHPYLAELAKVVTAFKRLFRLSMDACAAARQRLTSPLRNTLTELNMLLRIVQQDDAFAKYRAWIPLKRIIRSFNAHARQLEGATGATTGAGGRATRSAPSGGAGNERDFVEDMPHADEPPPEVPPRD